MTGIFEARIAELEEFKQRLQSRIQRINAEMDDLNSAIQDERGQSHANDGAREPHHHRPAQNRELQSCSSTVPPSARTPYRP